MYGWAWVLRLAAERHCEPGTVPTPGSGQKTWSHSNASSLSSPRIFSRASPIRSGPACTLDTAFALAQILDYARIVGDTSLAQVVSARAREYYFVMTATT